MNYGAIPLHSDGALRPKVWAVVAPAGNNASHSDAGHRSKANKLISFDCHDSAAAIVHRFNL